MAEFPTVKELAKRVANDVMENIELNGISLREFCDRVNNVSDVSTCDLRTCRYNQDGICQNEEKRSECVDVSLKVLCLDAEESSGKSGNSLC